MTTDQADFIKALNTVDRRLGDYAQERFTAGASFDEVQSQFRRVAEMVQTWRNGRSV